MSQELLVAVASPIMTVLLLIFHLLSSWLALALQLQAEWNCSLPFPLPYWFLHLLLAFARCQSPWYLRASSPSWINRDRGNVTEPQRSLPSLSCEMKQIGRLIERQHLNTLWVYRRHTEMWSHHLDSSEVPRVIGVTSLSYPMGQDLKLILSPLLAFLSRK